MVGIASLDKTKLRALGQKLSTRFTEYETARFDTEQKWLKNRRQFRGEYDAEIKTLLDADRSQVYPKITRVKVIGMVSRLMDLLFPQTTKNWNMSTSPFPDISEVNLNKVLAELSQAQQQGVLSDEVIEAGIKAFADKACDRMTKTIEDQLADNRLNYITLVRKVVFSSVLYGCGVLKGPLVERAQKRTWQHNPVTQEYKAETVSTLRPYYDFVSIWGFYPDLTAKDRKSMDGAFERHVMSRHEVRKLADRTDFFQDVITQYLKDVPLGDYKEKNFEAQLRSEKNSTTSNVPKEGKKYDLREWWGYIPAKDLADAGIEIPEAALSDDVVANVWLLGDRVIKAIISPYPSDVNIYHLFVYEEDEASLLGASLPDVLRESQLAMCASARMLLDNASVTCGPNVEVNSEVLAPGVSRKITAYKVWEREGLGTDANIPAVREIKFDSHITELQTVIQLFQGFADIEALLPSALSGDVGGASSGEPYRTARNTSQLMGAQALPLRDVVRNFDQFTESVIGSLYYWNMEFNDDDKIKGDYVVQARGSTSLISKEVRSQALDNLAQTLTPEDRAWLKTREMLSERLVVRDLPADMLLKTLEEYQQDQEAEAAKQEEARLLAHTKIVADSKQALSAGALNLAKAEALEAGTQLDTYEQALSTLEVAQNEGAGTGPGTTTAQPARGAGLGIAGSTG